MIFIQFLQDSLSTVSDFTALAKKIGYPNHELHKGALRLKEMRSKPLLGLDDEEYFDGTFGVRTIIEKLLAYFNASEEITIDAEQSINVIFEDIERHKQERSSVCNTIYINTDFKRNNEPVFVLAMLNHKRYISNFGSLYDLPLEEQINAVSKIVQEHYVESKGVLPIWGKIQNYHYKYDHNKPSLVFDTQGKVIQTTEQIPSHATLSLRKKEIQFSVFTRAATKEEAIRSVKKNSWTKHYIEPYLGDEDFLKSAVAYDSRVLSYAPHELRNVRSLMIELVKIKATSFAYASDDLQHDRELVKELITKYGVDASMLPVEYHEDPEYDACHQIYLDQFTEEILEEFRRCKRYTKKPNSMSK